MRVGASRVAKLRVSIECTPGSRSRAPNTGPVAAGDPAAALIRDDLRRDPIGQGRRALAIRSMLAADTGEGLSPLQAACWLDLKREYLALRPALRRVYTVVASIEQHGPTLAPLGFAPSVAARSTSAASPTTCSRSTWAPPRSMVGSGG